MRHGVKHGYIAHPQQSRRRQYPYVLGCCRGFVLLLLLLLLLFSPRNPNCSVLCTLHSDAQAEILTSKDPTRIGFGC